MIYFIIPLFILGAFQAVLAALLLAPLPLARPAISLCKASKTPVGKTFVSTISLVLLLLLVPPVLEVRDLRNTTWRSGRKDFGELDSLHRKDAEALAYLTCGLTVFALVMNFVLQKLGLLLAERELAKVKENALLKQVKGLHTEYDRLSKEQSGMKGSSTNSEAEKLNAQIADLSRDSAILQASYAEAEKRRKTAELNLDALKSQTKGLEMEYDRLLAAHTKLERQLAQADPSYKQQSGSKKDW